MEKKGKVILIGCVVVFLLFCLIVAAIGAAIGIPAYLEEQQVQAEKKAYYSAARLWNSTVPEYDQAKADFGNSLGDVGVLRTDLTLALVDGDKTTVSQKATELSKDMASLEKALQDMKSLNDDRKTIVSDLKAAMQINEGANPKEAYVDKADETTKDTEALLAECDKLVALMKEEQTWYEKYLVGTADTVAIMKALTDLGTQVNEQILTIQSATEKTTQQGTMPVN
ncbi:MAG: hypothetical protein WC891_00145 [Actinomycetota bacterium]